MLTNAVNRDIARRGGRVAGHARQDIETEMGVPVITSQNAQDFQLFLTSKVEDTARLGAESASWLCVLAAFPFALCSFFQYNGLVFEQFVWAFVRSEILCSSKLVFRADNLYAKMLATSSVKEALKID